MGAAHPTNAERTKKLFTATLNVLECTSQRNNNTHTTNMSELPSNLNEIRNAAAAMFSDPAVISVNVEATFGLVTVYRNGDIFMA